MKRKIFSVLFALVLVLSMSLVTAVPVAAQEEPATLNVVPFTLEDLEDATAEWSTAEHNTGSSSVELIDGDAAYEEARVKVPYGDTLGSLTNDGLDYWVKTGSGHDLAAILELDTDGDDSVDVVLHSTNIPTAGNTAWDIDSPTDMWAAKNLTLPNEDYEGMGMWWDGDGWDETTAGSDKDEDGKTVSNSGYFSLATWIAGVAGTGVDSASTVVNVGAITVGASTGTFYVDDITINGITYYGLIQDAVDTASADDTILVADGTYTESISVTTSNLTLRSVNGRDNTIIENDGNVVSPEAAQCGFLIRGPANNFTLGGAAGHGFTLVGGTAGRILQLNNGPSDITISYNTVNSTGTASMGISVGEGGATDLTVCYNSVMADGADGSFCTDRCLVDLTMTYNEFTGPGVTNEWGYTIEVAGITGTSTVSNNIITSYDKGIIVTNGGHLEYTGGTSGLLISSNNITGCGRGISFQQGVSTTGDMTTVDVTENTLSNNGANFTQQAGTAAGLYIEVGANVKADQFTIDYNNFTGNTPYGLQNDNVLSVNATNNYWGNASGPIDAATAPTSYGDTVSTNVVYEPWLLEVVVPEEPLPETFDFTLALKDNWTLVSTDKEVTANTTWEGTTVLADSETETILAYKYDADPSSADYGYTVVDMATQLTSVDAYYLKTDGGGGVGIDYSTAAPGVVTKTLSAGWNIISCAGQPDAYTLLSQLRYVQVGEEEGVGLTSLVGQGGYNQFTTSISETLVTVAEWLAIKGGNGGTVTLNKFDGFWVQMNAGRSFGVIP